MSALRWLAVSLLAYVLVGSILTLLSIKKGDHRAMGLYCGYDPASFAWPAVSINAWPLVAYWKWKDGWRGQMSSTTLLNPTVERDPLDELGYQEIPETVWILKLAVRGGYGVFAWIQNHTPVCFSMNPIYGLFYRSGTTGERLPT